MISIIRKKSRYVLFAPEKIAVGICKFFILLLYLYYNGIYESVKFSRSILVQTRRKSNELYLQ